MDASPFAIILSDLIARVPGAFACALVDLEGETVDYAGLGDPFEVKIAAAHLRILLRQIEEYEKLGDPRWIIVRGERRSVVARRLPDGYALVLLLRRRAGFMPTQRAYEVCERELAKEAAWPHRERRPQWQPVDVETDRRGRPRRVSARVRSDAEGGTKVSATVEVLGSVMGLPARERGFRVRLAHGTEVTLVREPGGAWYADDSVDERTASDREAGGAHGNG